MRRLLSVAAGALAVSVVTGLALADTPGVTATEIKIGNTVPYSGPASSYGVLGKLESAFFGMVNEQGGVAGHKINYISLDDSYSPPKTVEQIRKLVEQEKVAFTFGTLGTPTNSAIVRYMNQKKVPHLFVSTGADKWGDYKDTPWTIGWQPSYRTEAQIYTKYILQQKPNAKIAILYQNDDFGKDYPNGVKVRRLYWRSSGRRRGRRRRGLCWRRSGGQCGSRLRRWHWRWRRRGGRRNLSCGTR